MRKYLNKEPKEVRQEPSGCLREECSRWRAELGWRP